ncbi:hypothetical protein SLE2022_155900 [Rubroshorea leprosula]
MVASAISASSNLSLSLPTRTSLSRRTPERTIVSALPSLHADSSTTGLSIKDVELPRKIVKKDSLDSNLSYGAIEAKRGTHP